jgi:hypothetical protein
MAMVSGALTREQKEKVCSIASHALEFLQRALCRRRALWFIVGSAVLLASSSLWLGLTMDDHFHSIAVRKDPGIPGAARPAWDLFAAVKDPAGNYNAMEVGMFPWWTDPALVLAFLRPLSSLTLWLDRVLWPDLPLLMHLHSVAWFVLLLGAVYLVYRELSISRKHAALALLFYALDDARSTPIGWVAHRNSFIALAPAFLALVAHHRFRATGERAFAWLGPLCLALGLSGGESALQVCGYLFAYALLFDRARWSSRALSLLPYVFVVLAWRLLYDALGYGGLNSGMYVDPGREPLEFLSRLLVRLPVLLLAQFAGFFSDVWELFPVLNSWLQPAVFLLALGVIAGLILLFRPLLRRDPSLGFWALGSVLATIPVCGPYPEDRLLTATSLGAAALVAGFLIAVWEGRYPHPTRWVTGSAMALLAIHGVLAPVLLVPRILAIDGFESVLLRTDSAIAHGQKTVVLLNPPLAIFPVYLPTFRAAHRIDLPKHLRWLTTGESELRIERLDARTLKVTPAKGFLSSSIQRMFRRAERSFKPGEIVKLSDVSFQVTRLTPDGRPAEVVVRFEQELESERMQWLQWGEREYVPFHPPAVGKVAVVPAVDLKRVVGL